MGNSIPTTPELIETGISAIHDDDAQVFAILALASAIADLAKVAAPSTPSVRLVPTDKQIDSLVRRMDAGNDDGEVRSAVRDWLNEVGL